MRSLRVEADAMFCPKKEELKTKNTKMDKSSHMLHGIDAYSMHGFSRPERSIACIMCRSDN